MPTLTQPTGATLCPTFSGEITTLGTLTATKIDQIIALGTTTNPVTMAFDSIVLLTGATLSATDYPFAYNAMIAACKYNLLEWDRENQEGIPNSQGGGILIEAYNEKMSRYASTVGVELRKLGIYESPYFVFLQSSAERIGGANEILITEDNGTDC